VKRIDDLNQPLAVLPKESPVATRLADWASMAQGAFATNTLRAWKADWEVFTESCRVGFAVSDAGWEMDGYSDADEIRREGVSAARRHGTRGKGTKAR
jgi:hypothetical protein